MKHEELKVKGTHFGTDYKAWMFEQKVFTILDKQPTTNLVKTLFCSLVFCKLGQSNKKLNQAQLLI